MKCKACGGAGVIQGQAPCLVSCCPACDGKGFIELTNEEWLRSATTEELAELLLRFYYQDYCMNTKRRVIEWLKQPHTQKE